MDTDGTGWRFAQCFGDKGEVEDITEGAFFRQRDRDRHASPPPATTVTHPRV